MIACENWLDGWPITIPQENNFGKKVIGKLPAIKIEEGEFIQLFDETSNELIYAIRPPIGDYQAKVFDKNKVYKIVKLKGREIIEEFGGLKIGK